MNDNSELDACTSKSTCSGCRRLNEADNVIRQLRASLALDEVTADRVLAAASLKAAHPIAFADCFAAATAIAHKATLLTGDPELLDRRLGCRTRDLRPK